MLVNHHQLPTLTANQDHACMRQMTSGLGNQSHSFWSLLVNRLLCVYGCFFGLEEEAELKSPSSCDTH